MNLSRWIAALAATLIAATALAHNTEFRRVCLLTGMQEVPPNASNADGCGAFVIDPINNKITYRIVVTNLSGAETAATIYGPAVPGANGPMLFALPLGAVKSGVITYPQSQEDLVLSAKMYVNIATNAFPAGEVRGQIVTHVASIDAAQEVPANGSPARGFGLFMYDNVANTLDYYIATPGSPPWRPRPISTDSHESVSTPASSTPFPPATSRSARGTSPTPTRKICGTE